MESTSTEGKLTEPADLSLLSPSVSDSSVGHRTGISNPHPLQNPEILKTVFGFLDLKSLKNCRSVCRRWAATAQPLCHPQSRIYLRDSPFCDKEKTPKDTVFYRLSQLKDATSGISGGVNFKIGLIGPKLGYVLDKIKDEVKSLQLYITPGENSSFEDGPLSNAQFPNLKSLSWDDLFSHGNFEVTRSLGPGSQENIARNVLLFLEIISRSPNLQELKISSTDIKIRYIRIFFTLLLRPEGLPANERLKETLKSLSMHVDKTDFNNEDVETLRRMDLKLKVLKLRVDGRKNDFPALSLWLADLSSSLESLTLLPWYGDRGCKIVFPVEMKKLKTLNIEQGYTFEIKDIVGLLKGLPMLETLTLTGRWGSPGVKLAEFLKGTYDDISFPNLKHFKIVGEECQNKDECEPCSYVPKFFPELKTLSITIYSRSGFLKCSHELKEMMIEELELELCGTGNDDKKSWGGELPSFNSWKGLRKLSFSNWIMFGTDVYGIPMKIVLPASLTSLNMTAIIDQMDAGWFIEILEGLPRLMHLTLWHVSTVTEDGKKIKWSEVIDKIRKNPSINPYLYIAKGL